MQTLGVSVYPEMRPLDEIKNYLKLASSHGFTHVFSSMFSMPGTNDEVLSCFQSLLSAAHQYGMRVSLDINPECMERLGARPGDLSVFEGIGADILRMDGAYEEADNICMLQNPYGIQIEYNASTLTPQQMESLLNGGVDKSRILACHNFYPQRYTGFRWDRFIEVNSRLASMGVPVGAFIASHAPHSHGVWDALCGLPTVERLREYPAELQARVLSAAQTSCIIFGNAYATDDELEDVRRALTPAKPERSDRQTKVRVEPVYGLSEVEKTILFDFFPHVDMGDSSEWMWRSRSPRVYFKDETIEPRRYAARYFAPGDVVMVNDNYKHYAGEVQVVLQSMENDGTRNFIGRIDEQEFILFDVINDGDIVVFLPT